ncbi:MULTISPECIES: hypothetical protein [unclassified Streptomyces]|uniref:hypothetical protein n=1 Tax=unclassified Streptomyces TaxID=2593676 RepID=UPI00081E134D|nr:MULTISPECIES: hypothetical protein [unclassified Streptomyces]MYR98328.1 hypothetical protein [Streptomyces sp. SID4937]SCE36791.1 hypothetical protein GA0115243_1115219 [Streptomyces sp. ScaeMP-e83]
MTQTPNTTGNTGSTPNRPTPSTGSERVQPVTPPGNALGTPVPPTAAKPSGSPPTTGASDPASTATADKAHTDTARTDTGRTETARSDSARPDSARVDSDRVDAPRETGRTTESSHSRGTDTAKANGRPLFAAEEREKFDARIHQAVAGFVENPRQAVQEADATFDEVVTGLTQALAERSRLLRTDRDGERSEAGTEDLRIALQQYRDLTERLVRL